MTELSPNAQAVQDAAANAYFDWDDEGPAADMAAATLRAATELDESYGSSTKLITMSEQGLKYRIALAVKQAKVDTYRALRSIASELEGTKNAQKTH